MVNPKRPRGVRGKPTARRLRGTTGIPAIPKERVAELVRGAFQGPDLRPDSNVRIVYPLSQLFRELRVRYKPNGEAHTMYTFDRNLRLVSQKDVPGHVVPGGHASYYILR